MAYSGRCLLCGYINKRDPNQRTCTNSCRWKYDTHEAKETETGDIIAVKPKSVDIYLPEQDIITAPKKPIDMSFDYKSKIALVNTCQLLKMNMAPTS